MLAAPFGKGRSTNSNCYRFHVETGRTIQWEYSLLWFCCIARIKKIFIGTDYGIYVSTDNGATWTLPGSPTTTVYVNYGGNGSPLVASGTNLFALANLDIYQSTDDGASWKQVSSPDSTRFYCLATNKTALLVGTDKGVYQSTDNGASWNQLLPGFAIYSLTTKGNSIFAGSFLNGVFISTDNGITWSAPTYFKTADSWAIASVMALTTNGNTLIAGTFSAGLFISIDTGKVWTRNLNNNNVGAIAASETRIFAGTDSNGLFVSTDNSTTWATVDASDLPKKPVNSLVIGGNYLIAATDSGIYRKQIDELATGISKDNGTAHQFELNQNYPDPFNPTTTIQFSLQKSSPVSLDVYAFRGKRVMTLMEGQRPAGSHTVTFDGSHIASSAYFCGLQAESFIKMMKMVLVKSGLVLSMRPASKKVASLCFSF